jgi:AAA+ ATPase superfamily predicted ATPase
MIPERVRQQPNPYFPITSRLISNKFVGREAELLKFRSLLEDYGKTLRQKNFVVSGEKSIGKSTLLNRFKQILEDHNFIVYEVELPRDPSVKINEIEFFKDLINELFEKYGAPDGGFFDIQQSEIWFSLTSDKY